MRALGKEITGGSVMTLGSGAVGLIAFAYVAYVARQLGPADYSNFALALALHGVLIVVAGPIQNLLTFYTKRFHTLGEPRSEALLLRRSMMVIVAVFGVGALPVVALAGPLAIALELGPNPRLVSITYAMGALSYLLACQRGVVLGRERYWSFNLNILLEAAARFGIGVALFAMVAGVGSALSAYAVAMLVAIGLAFQQTRSAAQGGPPADKAAGVAAYLLPLVLVAAAFTGLTVLDKILAKLYLSDHDAGLYMSVHQIAMFVSVVAASFSTVVINLASESRALGKGSRAALARTVAYYLALGVAFVAASGLLGPWLVNLAFGASYAAAAPLLWPLCGGMVLAGLVLILCQYLLAYGRYRATLLPFAGVAVELLLVTRWHDSATTIANLFLVSQLGVALLLVALLSLSKAGSAPQRAAM